MANLRLQLRMTATLILLAVAYGVVSAAVTALTPVPLWIILVAVAAFLVGQYTFGVEMLLKQVNAREIPREEAPNLFNLVERASEEVGVDPPRIMVGELGGPNAFSVGRRRDGTVVVSDELVQTLDVDELAAVLSHEITHIENRDTIPMLLGLTLPIFFGYTLHRLEERGTISADGNGRVRSVLSSTAAALALLFALPLGRYRELVADEAAAEATGADALARALEKIAEEHGYDAPTATPALRSLFTYNTAPNYAQNFVGTHPPVQTRIDRLNGEL